MPKLENNIGWCDCTANRVIGCDKVSEGCKSCYAQNDTPARVLRHRGIETWGANGTRVVIEGFSKKVRRLNKFCICDSCRKLWPFSYVVGECEPSCGGKLRRIRLFADSNSDWLDLKWKIETFADLLRDIHECRNIDFQLLTKRPENFDRRMRECALTFPGYIGNTGLFWWTRENPKNVWLGVSVENQKCADLRIPQLLNIPAPIRFLSCEPLLEEVDLCEAFGCECGGLVASLKGLPRTSWNCPLCDEGKKPQIHQVICGGESGKGFREMPLAAAESLHDQCANAGVPFYMKQDSDFKNGQRGRIPDRIWKHEFPRTA